MWKFTVTKIFLSNANSLQTMQTKRVICLQMVFLYYWRKLKDHHNDVFKYLETSPSTCIPLPSLITIESVRLITQIRRRPIHLFSARIVFLNNQLTRLSSTRRFLSNPIMFSWTDSDKHRQETDLILTRATMQSQGTIEKQMRLSFVDGESQMLTNTFWIDHSLVFVNLAYSRLH